MKPVTSGKFENNFLFAISESKKETFIKIVLPLIVAENGKILDDKIKLKKITFCY